MFKVTYKNSKNNDQEEVKFFETLSEVNGFKVVGWFELGYYAFKIEKIA